MNLLARAKLSAGKRLLFPLHRVTAVQQFNFYSTKTTHISQRSQNSTNPRNQKSSESSPSFSRRIKKETGSVTIFPKPTEIPYQAKVANFVNLIGHVKTPIRFETTSDGKIFAATVISQENSGDNNSLLIPVVFEGVLAHVVASHVKENDPVFVSGKLSTDPMRVPLSDDSLGKFHVMAENLNFVEDLKRNVSAKKTGVSFSGVKMDKPAAEKVEEVIQKVDKDEDFNQQWKEALEHAKTESFSADKNDWASSSVSVGSLVVPQLEADAKAENSELLGSKQEKGDEKSGQTVTKKRDGDQIMDLWRDLVKNPLLWWDYRGHKANGLVKQKFPDFKHKATGDPLWINTVPSWVLPGLDKLEFDVKVIKPKLVQGSEGGSSERKNDGKAEDSWKNLVENPDKWWDNRVGKRYPKSPDFKHKETGEGLWLRDSPDWVASRLPPLKGSQNTA